MSLSRTFLVTLALGSGFAATALATDFDLAKLPDFKTQLDLHDYAGTTFYDFMTKDLAQKMNGEKQDGNYDDMLKEGDGVEIRLNEKNVNVHVNYYNDPLGGRSYGWTRGQVGDWSDKTILTNLITIAKDSDAELTAFYSTLVELLGSCDASNLSKLHGMSERVAVNFLAIYGAEAYRATLGTKNWDDALFEATMLAAFHAGQKKVTKFYMGAFQDFSYKQLSGIYNSRGPVALQPDKKSKKAADLTDYWQFSPNPKRKNSGINETRPDFEKMGEMITAYEKKQDNADLEAIEKLVQGDGKNVIKDVSHAFAYGQAEARDTAELAKHLASFLVKVRADANDITTFTKASLKKTKP